MSLNEFTVDGTLNSDGTLELDQKPTLPPGRVHVTVAPVHELPEDDPFWQRMRGRWADQTSRGFVPRTVEEIEAERRQVRNEWEERMRRFEQIRAEANALRDDRGNAE